MKSLKTIQTVAKVLRIIAKVIYILAIVGAVCSLIAAVACTALPFLMDNAELSDMVIEIFTDLDNVTNLEDILDEIAIAQISLWTSFLSCVAAAVIYKFAEMYFKHELEAGTPFTQNGAKEIFRLGLITVVVPICTDIVNGIVCMIIVFANQLSLDSTTDALAGTDGSLMIGLLLMLLSAIFRYGASIEEKLRNNQNFGGEQKGDEIKFDNDNNGGNDGNGIFYV